VLLGGRGNEGAAVFLALNAGGFVLKREPRFMAPMTGEPSTVR